ncbi:MAG: DUF4397 domain-containing protein [Gemmatirosa sp.]
MSPTRPRPRPFVAVPALAMALAACTESVGPIPRLDAEAGMRVVNATQAPIDVLVDGTVVLRGLPLASVSDPLPVTVGARVLQVRAASGATAEVSVDVAQGSAPTAVALGIGIGSSALAAQVLADTGALVPAGKSKLRVAHLAANGAGNVEIFRTQPDFQTPVRIQTPFPYRTTSPYLQSDPGTWEVFVAPAGSSGSPKLATTGPVNVPSGERRTVVLLDSAGVLRFRVIQE